MNVEYQCISRRITDAFHHWFHCSDILRLLIQGNCFAIYTYFFLFFQNIFREVFFSFVQSQNLTHEKMHSIEYKNIEKKNKLEVE